MTNNQRDEDMFALRNILWLEEGNNSAGKEIAEEVLEKITVDSCADEDHLVCADTVIKDLIENLIRGCGSNQYGIGDAMAEMIKWLVYARAALQQDCNVSDGFSRVKLETRSFCKIYLDRLRIDEEKRRKEQEFCEKYIAEEMERNELSKKMLAEGKARPYEEVLNDLNFHTSKGDVEKLKRLHRELKYYGDGVPFKDRHPWLFLMLIIMTVISGAFLLFLIVNRTGITSWRWQ